MCGLGVVIKGRYGGRWDDVKIVALYSGNELAQSPRVNARLRLYLVSLKSALQWQLPPLPVVAELPLDRQRTDTAEQVCDVVIPLVGCVSLYLERKNAAPRTTFYGRSSLHEAIVSTLIDCRGITTSMSAAFTPSIQLGTRGI